MFIRKTLSRMFPRIFISTLGVCAIVIATLAAGTFLLFDAFYDSSLKKSLNDSSSLIVASLHAENSLAAVSAMSSEFAKESGIRITIISSDGKIAFDSDAGHSEMQNHLNRPEVVRALKGKRTFVSRYSNTLKIQMLYLAVPAKEMMDGGYAYCVRLAVPQHNLDFAKGLLVREIAALSIIAVLFSAVASWLLARRISVPINSLKARALEFANGNFDSNVGDSRVYEIAQLGKSMTEMAGQLKKRMSSLHKRNCELDEIFCHMSECVLICTDEGLLLKANSAARKTFHIGDFDGSRPKTADVIHNRQLITLIEKTFADEHATAAEIDADGKTMRLETVMLPYESRTRRALFVLHDISGAKEAEKFRREFFAGVSHELKTPIAGIMGAAEVLKEGADSEETPQLLKIISRDSKRLNSLVEDMLSLSKLEAPEYLSKLNFKECDICGVLSEVLNAYENEAANRRQAITLSCAGPLKAKADPVLLSLAASNLVSNAVKYSFEGSEINIGANDAGGHIEIFVSDNGPGMDSEHSERVFERFYRIEKGRPRNLGGNGIGLAIVKHVAIMHGGEASVESKPGCGSRFKFTLKK